MKCHCKQLERNWRTSQDNAYRSMIKAALRRTALVDHIDASTNSS